MARAHNCSGRATCKQRTLSLFTPATACRSQRAGIRRDYHFSYFKDLGSVDAVHFVLSVTMAQELVI